MPAVMVDVDHGVVRAAGDLDIQSAPQMRQALQQAAYSPDGVVVDMSGVTFMDSTGLRELLRATSEGHSVTLRSVPEGVRSLLQLAGVESLFTID